MNLTHYIVSDTGIDYICVTQEGTYDSKLDGQTAQSGEIELGSVSRIFTRTHRHACYVGSWEANDFYQLGGRLLETEKLGGCEVQL